MKVTSTQVLIGIAAAAAAGAAIGMLLAPEKGTELQNRIREGTRAWLDEATRLLGVGGEKKVRDTETQLGELKSNLARIED